MGRVPSIRADLVTVEPYRSPQRPARVRMNTNESPFGPPPAVMEAMQESLKDLALNRYPDHSATELYEALAAHTGFESARCWIANGSNEVFLHLYLAYGGARRKVLTFEPTYSMHSKIARVAGSQVVQAERAEGWTVPEATLEESLARDEPDVCVFCSPNNPTGALESRAAIELAVDRVPLVIVDEAYVEFSRTDGHVDLLERHPNLVIVRTLSKAWRLAGGRIGYALGAPEVIEPLKAVALPYGLSSISQSIGVAVLRRAQEALGHVEAICSERERLVEGLRGLGLEPWPSAANFVLVPFPYRAAPDPGRASKVWEGLLAAGVLVRDYSSEVRLSGHLRVTVGTPEETDAFLDALTEVLDD